MGDRCGGGLLLRDQSVKGLAQGCGAGDVAVLPLGIKPGDLGGRQHEADGDVLGHAEGSLRGAAKDY
ncbi:MAG: hypothetical protein ABFE07_14645 [Armatimonadia bacterium]